MSVSFKMLWPNVYRAGRAAYLEGKRKSDCPHEDNSMVGAWLEGYEDQAVKDSPQVSLMRCGKPASVHVGQMKCVECAMLDLKTAKARLIDQTLIDDVKRLQPRCEPFFHPSECTSEGESWGKIIKLLVAVAEQLNKEK